MDLTTQECAKLSKKIAKGFAEWMLKHTSGYDIYKGWYYTDKTGRSNKTTDELVDIFLNDDNKTT